MVPLEYLSLVLALQDFELPILLFIDMHHKIWNNHEHLYT
jgi:hypothetical protein